MQKTSHNIQNPHFPKLIELWVEECRLEDCKKEKRMKKEKTEHMEEDNTAYTCVILALELRNTKASIYVKGGTFIFYSIKPLSKPSKEKICEGPECTEWVHEDGTQVWRLMKNLIAMKNVTTIRPP